MTRPGQTYWNGEKRVLATVYHVRTGVLVVEAKLLRHGFELRYRRWKRIPDGFELQREPKK